MTKILLVDDHKLFRESLRIALERQKEFEVVGEADNGDEAIAFAQNIRPDIVLLDVQMPGMNGIEAAKKIKIIDRRIKIIFLTMYEISKHISNLESMGFEGFVSKEADLKELLNAIRRVARGEKFFSTSNLK